MGNVCFLYTQLVIQHWHISFRLNFKTHFQHGEYSYTGIMDAYGQKHAADMWNVKASLCIYHMYFNFINIICIVFTSNYISERLNLYHILSCIFIINKSLILSDDFYTLWCLYEDLSFVINKGVKILGQVPIYHETILICLLGNSKPVIMILWNTVSQA